MKDKYFKRKIQQFVVISEIDITLGILSKSDVIPESSGEGKVVH